MSNPSICHTFYTAFQNKDYETMQNLYDDEAIFSDAAFQNLNALEVRAMWEMLIKRGKDLVLEYEVLEESEHFGKVRWVATYSFSKTGRKVVNVINARMKFIDGKIMEHYDDFDFYKWGRQAFGFTGSMIGWTSFFQNKVRSQARKQLLRFMDKK
ncbi:MAG: nuclear transport factor 2 family protein [Bacteroidota bacterium]